MSIFKETFRDNIKNQIKTRQEALLERTPDSIQYYNSRTAWIRMTSAVNVGIDNGALAKDYVLLGGTLNNKGLYGELKSGVGGDKTFAYSNVTPGGTENRMNIRPMPGITGIEVKNKSAYGSLREVTVNFQCWDIRQLEELELLYMRPGYSVLVEWGWLPYLDNNKRLFSSPRFINDVLNGSFPSTLKENIWKKIQNTSLASFGNYDAHYGFIKNYSWSARPDGGYDCTTSIISMGEILESLKINYGVSITNIPTKGIFNLLSKSDFGKDKIITKAYNENKLAGICAELHEIGIKKGSSNQPFKVKDYQLYRAHIEVKGGESQNDSQKGISSDNEQIYIALKDFIDILNKEILIRDKKPLCELSLNYGEHNGGITNPVLCLGDIHQISVDPTVCLINNPAWYSPENLGLQNIATSDDFDTIKTILEGMPSTTNYSYWIGDWKTNQMAVIGNIFVNVAYIYSLVVNPNVEAQDKKEKNDIALYDLLKNIMSGVNSAIGSVANFEVFLDSTDNITRIIDINYTGNREDDWKKINEVPIELQNLKSIVRNYKLESQIFPEQSSVVAIGAQAQGGALASDTNTLIDFNQNLIDRIIPKKDVKDITNTNPPTQEEINQQLQNQKDNLGIIISYITNLKPSGFLGWWGGDGFDINDSGKYSNALKDIINYQKAFVSVDTKNRAIIPTKLSLTMDGIGGIIIGNLFKIPDEILPRGYRGGGAGPAKIGYAVTGLNHSIQNNDWTTTVEAQFIIMDEPKGLISENDYELIKARNLETATSTNTSTKLNTNQNYRVNPPIKNLALAAENSIGFNTAGVPGTQNGNLGCACAVSVMFLRATGYQIIPGRDIVLGTGELYSHLKSDTKNWKIKPISAAQPGDIIVTARGNSPGHTGIVSNTVGVDGSYSVISNSSTGYTGTVTDPSKKGTIQRNYTVKTWNSKITTRNPNQSFAFQYLGPYNTSV